MGKSEIKFRGGHSKKHVAHETTATGRTSNAPRWTPSAAAAAVRSIKAQALKTGQDDWSVFTYDCIEKASAWAKLTKTLRKDLTAIQAGVALPIFEQQRLKILAAPVAKRPGLVANSFLRCMRKRAKECPRVESLGIPAWSGPTKKSFLEVIEGAAAFPVRKTPPLSSGEGPLQYSLQWDLDRVATPGVVVFARAGDRVRDWRKTAGANAQVELKLAQSLVHTDILPTATANKQDQWWLTGPRRYMSVPEACRCMGIRDTSPLARTLALEKHPSNAIQWLGRAVHASVALLILELLEAEGLLPIRLRYGSACSGIDTMAEAVDVMRPGGLWGYVHAAELRPELRNVLQKAWAMPQSRLLSDASLTATAPEVDLYMITPDCHAFSRRRHGRDAGVVAGGAMEVVNVSPFVAAGRAAVVVVENVGETDGADAITTVITSYPMYEWRSQELDPQVHAGVPAARRRRFWVGVRHGTVRRAFPVHQ